MQHRRFFVWGVVLLFAGLGATPAAASEVVDVRIGAHDDFTRVVFELDQPAGYRIERGVGTAAGPELVVTIEASSIPRNVQATKKKKSLIQLVSLKPDRDRTVARIQLTRTGLKLKEMILTGPPRIVLDVLPSTSAKATPKPAPKPAPEPEPVKTAAKPAPEPEPAAATRAETPAPEEAAGPRTREDAAPAATDAAGSELPDEPSEGGIPSMGRAAAQGETAAEAEARRAREAAEAAAAKKVVKKIEPARMAPESSSDGGSTWLYGILLVVVAAGIVLVLRRRRAAAAEEAATLVAGDMEPTAAENPFADVAGDSGEDSGDQPVSSSAQEAEIGFDPHAPDSAVKDLGLEAGKGGLSGIASVAPGGAAGDEDVERMMQEFERRIASLESRLDEVVDARERLERQVAAQTEELRVQRAAIARTQRAVRNLARSEDEGPTEPAIKDPEA